MHSYETHHFTFDHNKTVLVGKFAIYFTNLLRNISSYCNINCLEINKLSIKV